MKILVAEIQTVQDNCKRVRMWVRNSRYLLWACMLVAGPAQAAEPTGQELVALVERLLWGKTNQGTAEMTS